MFTNPCHVWVLADGGTFLFIYYWTQLVSGICGAALVSAWRQAAPLGLFTCDASIWTSGACYSIFNLKSNLQRWRTALQKLISVEAMLSWVGVSWQQQHSLLFFVMWPGNMGMLSYWCSSWGIMFQICYWCSLDEETFFFSGLTCAHVTTSHLCSIIK